MMSYANQEYYLPPIKMRVEGQSEDEREDIGTTMNLYNALI